MVGRGMVNSFATEYILLRTSAAVVMLVLYLGYILKNIPGIWYLVPARTAHHYSW